MEQSPAIIAIVGPTASGKTDLGLELAKRLRGEIISADSRQMYRRLDAGTSKPPGSWEKIPNRTEPVYRVDGVPYHLVDILDPSETTDAGKYAAMAEEAMRDIDARRRRPIFVGGTGLYLRACLEGLDPLPPRSQEVREELAELAEANGRAWLHEELARVDPEAARRIAPDNLHRVARALEVFKLTGRPISSLWSGRKLKNGRPTIYLGIQWDRAGLEKRIRGRSETTFPKMIAEASRLTQSSSCSGQEPGFQSLGYPEALRCARGEISEPEGLALMIRATMQYAKRQATWFKRQTAVQWIPCGRGDLVEWADQAAALIERFDARDYKDPQEEPA